MASVPVKALEQEPIQRLPAGSHGIPAEVVALNQRERLISAIAEVCAEKGYAEIAVADVVRRAGVSTATRGEAALAAVLVSGCSAGAAGSPAPGVWVWPATAVCDFISAARRREAGSMTRNW